MLYCAVDSNFCKYDCISTHGMYISDGTNYVSIRKHSVAKTSNIAEWKGLILALKQFGDSVDWYYTDANTLLKRRGLLNVCKSLQINPLKIKWMSRQSNEIRAADALADSEKKFCNCLKFLKSSADVIDDSPKARTIKDKSSKYAYVSARHSSCRQFVYVYIMIVNFAGLVIDHYWYCMQDIWSDQLLYGMWINIVDTCFRLYGPIPITVPKRFVKKFKTRYPHGFRNVRYFKKQAYGKLNWKCHVAASKLAGVAP